MFDFQVGYARVNINPPLGSALFGYYVQRIASGFLDVLEAFAIALVKGNKKFLIISIDNCSIGKELVNKFTAAIEEATGIPRENILISATHTHTGPFAAKPGAFAAGENEGCRACADERPLAVLLSSPRDNQRTLLSLKKPRNYYSFGVFFML